MDAQQPTPVAGIPTQRQYPMPSYLPDGFALVAVYADRFEGFRGGPTELVLWYRNQKHPQAFPHSLSIYLAPNPQSSFTMAKEHQGKPVQLVIAGV